MIRLFGRALLGVVALLVAQMAAHVAAVDSAAAPVVAARVLTAQAGGPAYHLITPSEADKTQGA